MKLKLLFAMVLITQMSFAQGFLTKGIAKLAKKVGGGQTATASSLSDIVPTVSFGSNLHSDKLGTMSQAFFNGWKTGGDGVSIMFTKQHAPGFFKIDGSVTVNGTPVEYLTSGMYGLITDASDGPRKIEITTTGGEKSSFVIEPSKKIVKLTSINGQQSDNVALDLTKDVTLELTYPAGMEGQLMKVSIAITQLSIKSIFDVCYVKIAPKVVIPPSAFRNISIIPGGKAVYSFKNSYLSVGTESIENAKEVSGAFSQVQYISQYNDGKFVNITNEPDLNKGLIAKDQDKALQMDYNFFKPNAFLSRPFSQIKKIGLTSFAIRGTTYDEAVEVSKTETQTEIITTTKITKITFPQQPNEAWDALMEKMYVDLVNVLETEFNASVLPVEKITSTTPYKTVEAYSKDDVNTKVEFSRAFRDTKLLSAWMPVTEGYAASGANARIMEESGADALMNITLDLEISQERGGDLVLMVPKLAIEISGKSNGLNASTKYLTGTIQSVAGVSFKNNITMTELENIIRKSDMIAVLRKEIRELKEKEAVNGDYTSVWSLR